MSLAGRPKMIARKAHEETMAEARKTLREETQRIDAELTRLRNEALAPLLVDFASTRRKADAAYFAAIGDQESARQLLGE